MPGVRETYLYRCLEALEDRYLAEWPTLQALDAYSGTLCIGLHRNSSDDVAEWGHGSTEVGSEPSIHTPRSELAQNRYIFGSEPKWMKLTMLRRRERPNTSLLGITRVPCGKLRSRLVRLPHQSGRLRGTKIRRPIFFNISLDLAMYHHV